MLRFRLHPHTLYSLIFSAVFLVWLIPVVVSAQVATSSTSDTSNFGVEQGSFDGTLKAPNTDLRGAIVLVVKYLLGFLGILMVIIILYGGYVWMTAGANADRIERAKKIIINAIIGLVIILSAFAIVSFIFRELGNQLGGGGTPCPGCRDDRWRSGIGLGPIESVYPEPNQREVPINTWIAVTFKEQIDPATICEGVSSDGRCAGGKMKNVDICILGEGTNCVDDTTPDNFSKDELAATRVYQTSDGRTFVFYPNKYLGFEDGADRNFYVTLKSGINSKLTNESIFARWGGQQYGWQFTTNGELDLDPPEVVSTNTVLNPPSIASVSGVFPDPDNLADTYSQGSDPTTTRFSILIDLPSNNAKIKNQITASTTVPVGTPTAPTAAVTGTYGGSKNGTITVALNGNVMTVSPGFGFVESQSYSGTASVTLGNGLQINFSAIPVSGNSWTFAVTAPQTGDAIEVLDNTTVIGRYVFGSDVQVGSSSSVTIQNIKDKILANHQNIFKDCTIAPCLPIVDMQTIATGAEGGRYSLRFAPSDATRTDLIRFDRVAGSDVSENITVKGRPDVARNAVFQIQFNEAINPLVVDSEAFTVRYGATSATALSGPIEKTVAISNQYQTIELVGTEPCPGQATNQCGSPISCWPVNDFLKANPGDYAHKATRFEVAIAAAPLRTCTGDANTDNWCALWQGKEKQTCSAGSRCIRNRDAAYYPGIDLTRELTGLIDMSGNSLNGSFDYFANVDRSNKVEGRAQGQSGSNTQNGFSGRPAYNLNNSNPLYSSSTPVVLFGTGLGFGDDFSWSFWLSDKVELRSPLISKIDPIGDALFKDFRKAIEVTFDRIMRSSTLRPGWNYGDTDRSRSERYLVFDTITKEANPVGYWINNLGIDSNKDQFPDFTRADVLHSQLDPNITYGPQGGSGLQDVYQNCYLPGVGPANAAAVICKYADPMSTTTINCSPSRLPNPASYAYMNCSDISGATQCGVGKICQALYATSTTDGAGSWIITKDFPLGQGSSGGCCLGRCIAP